MKKLNLNMMVTLCMIMLLPTIVYANMAEPKDSDIGSSITFEHNNEIAVLSEVLDIMVTGTQAEITATYTMKNTTDGRISTSSMFVSPNIEQSRTEIYVDDKLVNFEHQSYCLEYDTELTTKDWQYVVLTDREVLEDDSETVDTVSFDMTYEANEQYNVVVSYTYNLGGYPDYDFNAKRGEIYYYLAPATMWKDFESLTINLYLDEDMPIITHSNLKFEKVGNRTYQYVSDTLPTENLEITIDENWFQNIFSTLRSPYFLMMLKIFSPFIVITVVIIIFVVWRICKRKVVK